MENQCNKSDLLLIVKRKNVGRFKPGAELSGKVNIMNVEVNEEITDSVQELEVRLHLSSEVCSSKEQE
jgi:hypothetical protein